MVCCRSYHTPNHQFLPWISRYQAQRTSHARSFSRGVHRLELQHVNMVKFRPEDCPRVRPVVSVPWSWDIYVDDRATSTPAWRTRVGSKNALEVREVTGRMRCAR